ncbi:MAG TPA: transglycosylase domain-containing protein [Actinomycetota bacterium]|nr:transglycosylase domain-containing protein [Actinomycetota bacterium]
MAKTITALPKRGFGRGIPPGLRIALWPVAMAGVMALCALLVAAGLLPIIGGAGAAEKLVQQRFFGDVTQPLGLPKLQQRSTIYAANGEVLAHVWWNYNRQDVTLQQVAPVAQQAVLSIEDHAFYQHGGVDVPAIVRAMIANLRAHAIVQGGSTIAQQLIKNTETGNAETLQRKMQEAKDALRLEHSNNKNAILQTYLNQIYLGHGVYGIGTAAEYYFNEKASQLTLPQAALLAGMIKGPTIYDPISDRAAALTRRGQVLAAMLQYGMITQSQYQKASSTPLKLSRGGRGVIREPMWVSYVTGEFLNDPRFGKTYIDRKHLLFQGGLNIYTTLSPKYQRYASAAMTYDHLSGPNHPQRALASIVPQTGAIRAMQNGNYPWSHTKYNLTTDPTGGRSAGSAFKAFTLATALLQGISPNAVYNGNSPKTIPDCGGTGVNWTVHNAEPGGGTYTLTTATWDSVNAVFAQVINQVGPDNVADVAAKMGITTRLKPAYCPLTLGAAISGINPLEMASGYATLANGGVHCVPYSIQRISDSSGKTIFRQKPDCTQAIPAGVASEETRMLEGVLVSGTAAGEGLGNRPAAGKTGTGENFQDAWFVGYVRQLATAVWTGWARSDSESLGSDGFGGVLSAPVWHRFMVWATAGMPVERFPYAPPPHTRTSHVPDVVGKTSIAAQQTLTAAKFGAIVKTGPSTQPAGIVFKQSPAGGSSAPLGSAVTIWVSNGHKPTPRTVLVPNVLGSSKTHARSLLQSVGLAVNMLFIDTSDPAQDGVVLKQSPGPGARVGRGSAVTITVGHYTGSPTPSPT